MAGKKDKSVCAVQEMLSTEETFLYTLRLISEDYANLVLASKGQCSGCVIPREDVKQMFKHFTAMKSLSETLVEDLKERIKHWEEKPKVADLFVKMGPFLKMYSDYIGNYSSMCEAFEKNTKMYPEFEKVTKEFEKSERCRNLAITAHIVKPIQRIPQYRLMLQEYKKHLKEDSEEYKETETALRIVSGVAEHANKHIYNYENSKVLLEIQNNLTGEFKVIKPGRVLLKSGILQEFYRSGYQPVMLFLFNDVLLCTVPLNKGYKYKCAFPLDDLEINNLKNEDKNEFRIKSREDLVQVSASTSSEKEEWLNVLEATISEYITNKNTPLSPDKEDKRVSKNSDPLMRYSNTMGVRSSNYKS